MSSSLAIAQPGAPCAVADSAVYVAVLDSLYRGTLRTAGGIVRRPALDLSQHGDGAWAGGQLARRVPGFDSALVVQLHKPRRGTCGPGRALRNRPGVFWHGDVTLVWRDSVLITEPRTNVPELSVSAVQYAADGATAVLFQSFWCGLLCAQSDYVVLKRASDGRWRIVDQLRVSAS